MNRAGYPPPDALASLACGGGVPALIIRTGPQAGGRIEIDGEVVIGRGEVDWVIADPGLSRRHLAARVGPTGVVVEDLGSLNGTWLDGRRLDGPTPVGDGGVIRLGETELVVELGGVSAADRPAAVPAAPAVSPAPGAARPVAAPLALAPGVPPGAFAPAGAAGRRRVATRMMVPAGLTFLTIFATAIALIVYFATR